MIGRILIPILLATGAAQAQQPSPYAGMTDRAIKALSDDQVRQLESGEGLGFALAAELNRYPGPRHVLELADSLGLTPGQRDDIRRVERDMRDRARALGALLVARERELDRVFAESRADSASVRDLTADIARLTGELRYAHLAAHLAVTRLLDPGQRHRYQEFRGYAAHGAVHHH
jgi:Spy/CpxP family protein refolding chaperone